MYWDDWTGGARSATAHTASKLFLPPSVEPFTVAEAKLHCKIDHDADNANVVKWIRAARTKVERDTGRALLTQTWDFFLDAVDYQGTTIRLPYPPLQSVASVNQTDTVGVETVWSSANYVVDTASEPGRIALTTAGAWPSNTRSFQPVRVRFVAGWASPEVIPDDLKQAMALWIGWFDQNREPNAIELQAYDALIGPYVIFSAA
jgi:uncharacterized phiE125 gp8 family phage protein